MKQRKIGNNVIRDRAYKVGDVIRWIPSYASWKQQDERGLGIVIEVNGHICKTYWTGDKTIRTLNTVLERNMYILQDYAPIPQVKEAVELALKAGRVVEDNRNVRVV